MPGHKLEERIKAKARELGFAAVGLARADAAPRTAERLRQWLAEGMHGDMIWMEGREQHRASPAGLWPEVRSVIALGMSYAPTADPLRLASDGGVGRISVYAQGSDYHDVVKRQLKALGRWLAAEAGCDLKVFVDTAPVMEKPLAEAAGLGWQGKHTNLVSREHGSWLFLGAIYTTLDLEPDAVGADTCGSCDACQRACPTDAFPAPYRLDARRCISYLTIEHAGPIPLEFREAIGNRIYGCDDCLAVCPWNKFAAAASANLAFAPRAELAAPDLADLLALDDAGFRQVFAGSPIKRIGRDRMVRNAAIAAGNSGDRALAPALAALADDASEVVSEAAGWALERLARAPVTSTTIWGANVPGYEIIDYHGGRDPEVAALILGIQRLDVGLDVPIEEQPELLDLGEAYRDGGFWVAVAGGEIVGTIGMMRYGASGVLKKLFVREDYRGRGGASQALYDKAIDWAAARGLTAIFLDTPSVATRSHAFYQRRGFSIVNRTELPEGYDFPDRDSLIFKLDMLARASQPG